MPLTGDDIQAVFRAIYHREIPPAEIEYWLSTGMDLETLLKGSLNSNEFRDRIAREYNIVLDEFRGSSEYLEHNGPRFRVPRELQVTPTPLKRVLLVGHCLLADWPTRLSALGVVDGVDHVLLAPNEAPVAPHPADAYSFQVTHIANRYVFGDHDVLSWIKAGYGEIAKSDALLQRAKVNIDRALKYGTVWRDKMPVFVTNLLPPQQEFNGRLTPRLRTDSIRFFFDRLNDYLRESVAKLANVYVLDVEDIFATIGNRHLLDDTVIVSAHASFLTDSFHEEDRKRLIPSRKPTEYYDIKPYDLMLSVWCEAEAMYRTLRQIDQVKMVCVDLDDTLWRGVLAEAAEIDDIDPYLANEGWPIGVAEALAVLKRRGVLLCVLSKNTPERARAIFEKVYRANLSLDDFAIQKINWRSKPENMRDALAEANLLPSSVVFLDDNPVERAAMKKAFPEIRVIEAPHYYWRRILLWSAETQTATITPESARRTEMVQAQVKREASRADANPEDFLAGLMLRMDIAFVQPSGKRFERALELLNKSNQFNTTGRRWTAQELAAVANDGFILAVAVSDKFTDYGDTLIAVVRGDRIEQLVMSCRVVGLGVELAAVAAIAQRVLAAHPRVVARIIETNANILARDLFARCGWTLANGEWSATTPGEAPPHAAIEFAMS
jgi:FkbH-like protein